MKSLSFNGIDGSGKTTQIKLLEIGTGNLFSFTRPLIEYSDRWPKISGEDLSKWWFEDISMQDFVGIIIDSLNKRNSVCPHDQIAVLDRGVRMFKAVCAATWATRFGGSAFDFVDKVNCLFERGLTFDSENEVEVFLVPSKKYFDSISNLVGLSKSRPKEKFSSSSQKRYQLYQKHLLDAVCFYFSGRSGSISVSNSIIDTHNAVRDIIGNGLNIPLKPVSSSLQMMVGLGGMSECGKSSFGDYLRLKHDFYRLKIRYFTEALKLRGVKPNPVEISMELIRFIEAHYFVEKFSLESLHGPDLPAFLKLLFGERYKTVYIDASFDKRVKRSMVDTGINICDAENRVREKDAKKWSSGALGVKDFAEIVFDNDSDNIDENFAKFANLLGV